MNTTNDQIDWRQNCLTAGVHDGRPEAIWKIPLGYAVLIYNREMLRDLVIARIYRDAMQIVEHNDKFDQAWALRVQSHAQEKYDHTMRQKVADISRYYASPMFENDSDGAVRRFAEGKLNPFYAPLHDHDTINMLCRIVGVSASRAAS